MQAEQSAVNDDVGAGVLEEDEEDAGPLGIDKLEV